MHAGKLLELRLGEKSGLEVKTCDFLGLQTVEVLKRFSSKQKRAFKITHIAS